MICVFRSGSFQHVLQRNRNVRFADFLKNHPLVDVDHVLTEPVQGLAVAALRQRHEQNAALFRPPLDNILETGRHRSR